ncbi:MULTISPECIES: hypothetical protein [unclassified Mesorhizobium]|uniref:hypothetical protein n=1 Tax=unclassified Mesorhizobium TaxID=325217 RepID=UPI000FCCBA2B|nr:MULTISPECIES: hypothetical protein [unclassified Mesorhizobium]TGP27964.1 hypothetical protein EN875_032920 [Mesorhizobium sp. M2D.F.Ca.ET.232.01.1.1]TGQ25553.1 hypothetical protein EN863_057125 [Mesorhizobium sp. M00.F.Ca.ET.220.01.1.1]TGT97831.1 hypothetical protein EN806_48490 [bacterium M00.F.Ca.ET.163.01.1.1]
MSASYEDISVKALLLADEIRLIGTQPIESSDDAGKIGRVVQDLAARLAAIGAALTSSALNPQAGARPF